MESDRINQQLHAYLNGNLSEVEIKAFEEKLMDNPELNHQMNQKRFKAQQSNTLKQSNKKPNRINWLPIVVILVSVLFASQFLLADKKDQNVSALTPSQEQAGGDNDDFAEPNLEKKSARRKTILASNTNIEINQKAGGAAIDKTVAQEESITQKENSELRESTELEYVMLAKQLYSASDYPTGEELLSKEAGPAQNKNFFEGITAYAGANNMKQAILSFQKISSSAEGEDYESAKPYLAHAYFKLGNYQKAKSLFEELSRSQNSKVTEDAEWFLALSLLSDYTKQKDKLNTLLKKMLKEENKHRHFKDAVYFKEDLKKIASFRAED